MGAQASGLGRDYDAFDLVATIADNWSGSGTTYLYPLLYEGIGSVFIPPAGFLVPAPYNYHLGLDNLNITNGTADAAVVFVQLYEFGTAAEPFGVAGPVVFTQGVAAGATATIDQTKFRLSASTGFFFDVFTLAATYSSDFIYVNARGRWTEG